MGSFVHGFAHHILNFGVQKFSCKHTSFRKQLFNLRTGIASTTNAHAMKKLLLILFSAYSLIFALSCKKLVIYDPDAEPVLPVISADGRNTFGLMFGNEVWVPHLSSLPALSANFGAPFGSPSRLIINCNRKSTRTNAIDDFTLQYFSSDIIPGTYQLNSSTSKVVVNLSYPDNKVREYQLHGDGTITFSRWDLVNKIASGTFSMTLKEVVSGEKVSITQGRFDVKLSN